MYKYLLILFILVSTNAIAAISKWVDENNQTHYSDRPPPSDAKVKTLSSIAETESAASGVPPQKTIAEREADWKKAQKEKQDAADQAAKKQAAADAQQASCNTAQEYLRALQSGIRVAEIDAKGERSFIDDKQREERVAKAQKDVSNYCK